MIKVGDIVHLNGQQVSMCVIKENLAKGLSLHMYGLKCQWISNTGMLETGYFPEESLTKLR